LVGGGRVAAGKFRRLLQFTDEITVVAPEIADEIKKSAGSQTVLIERDFELDNLCGVDFVVAASDDKSLNGRIAAECRHRHIPVNSVDDTPNCDFIFPAIIKKGDLTVSISSGGASPAYAALLKKQIAEIIPENIDEILEKMLKLRKTVPEKYPELDQHERSKLYKKELITMLSGEGDIQ